MDHDFCAIVATALSIPSSEVRDELTPETTTSWTSLAMVEIITAIEKHYNIGLELDELVQFTSVGAMRSLLRSKGVTA
jgi:acyl carrier protein